jgi:hypothetical protein
MDKLLMYTHRGPRVVLLCISYGTLNTAAKMELALPMHHKVGEIVNKFLCVE